jgi:hypothetical protein
MPLDPPGTKEYAHLGTGERFAFNAQRSFVRRPSTITGVRLSTSRS